ncbi:MAG: amidohydrolase family protein [Candidatus Hermodarchaeota archaeon]
MEKLIIKNGLVYDPMNNVEGEIKDILIEKGKIVEKFTNQNDVQEIDAKSKTIIPSALEIHAHIASQQTNWARLLGIRNEMFNNVWNGLSLDYISKSYISNGYTFILEANVYPSLAKQTIFNFNQIPVLDKAMLLNVSNFWPLELEFQRGKIDDMAMFLSELLSITKAFGFKAYNPFEAEDWDFKSVRTDLSKNGRLYNFSALDVYENLTRVNEHLGMPHSIHAHIEGYETSQAKDNLITLLEQIKSLKLDVNSQTSSSIKRTQILHLAHASAYNIDGNNKKFIEFMNNNQDFDLDLGFVGFDELNPLITSDRRLIHKFLDTNSTEIPSGLITSAVETEGDSFINLRSFDKNNEVDCRIWGNAIELALNIKNKWQLQFSVNFPNYAHINDIPEIIAWLVSNEARTQFMKDMNQDFIANNSLNANDTCLTFNEVVIISRASPAKSLGLGNIKGNLGLNADADLNIINIDAKEMDFSKDIDKLKNAFSNIEYVIKSGEIIKQQDNYNLAPQGRILWSEGKVDKTNLKSIMTKKEEFYSKFGSTFYDALKVSVKSKHLRQII